MKIGKGPKRKAWLMGALMTAGLSSQVFPAHGAQTNAVDTLADDPVRLRLPADSVRMTLGAGMQIQGLPVRAQVFQTAASLRETADLIASQAQATPSLWVLPGAILLAWQSGSHHWLARLTQPNAEQTYGVVSVLSLPADAGPTQAPHATALAWLPAQAKLLFTFDSEDGREQVRQRLYRHDLPPLGLWPQVRARLRQNGWQHQSGGAVAGDLERWERGAYRLMLQVVPVSGGSGMVAVVSGPK